MQARDILSFWQHHKLDFADDEGFRYGSPDVEVGGVMVAWMATLAVIEAAREKGCNLLIVHEDILFPPGYTRSDPVKFLSGRVNSRRLAAMAAAGLTVLRAHGTLDRLCILDDFAATLGLPEPVVRDGYFRVYELEPTPVKALVDRVTERLGLASARLTGDPEQVVQRPGLPWGGLGLSLNAAFMEGLFRHNIDVMIAGETDEYTQWAAQDAGIPLIETSHTVSEEPGLRHAAEMLAAHFPEVPVHFYEMGRPWAHAGRSS